MNTEDHAIVVGIATYPGFGATQTQPRNLQGPDNDAIGVYDWLTSATGGDVPKDNVTLIRSAGFPPASQALGALPAKQQIIDAFDKLDSIADTNDQNNLGQRVGRRLYLYMSGHGFAPRRREGAMFVANATRNRTHHVFASRWQEWFSNAEYFDELVLWMDCCMVSDLTVTPEPAGFRVLQGTSPKKMFSAYAARFPQQAVERLMPDGQVHGVFTYTLLQGLGVAEEPGTGGQVTSASLKSYLLTEMKKNFSPDQLKDPSVSQEPDFGYDDAMVFCTLQPHTSTVTLTFPAAAEGRGFRVMTGAPPTAAASGVVRQGKADVHLPVGFYVVKVDGLSISSGFEIAGAEHANVNVA